jgi:hypothetical protein
MAIATRLDFAVRVGVFGCMCRLVTSDDGQFLSHADVSSAVQRLTL